jgi:hypothetical protein
MRPLTWSLKEVDPIGLHMLRKFRKILRYIKSDMYTAFIWQENGHLSTMVNPTLSEQF